jgi:PelA/Pel-15E family pectate lyase
VGLQNRDDSMTQKHERNRPKWLPVVTVAIFAQLALAEEPADVTKAKTNSWKAIDAGAFTDSINHAVMKYEGGKAPYDQYSSEQIVHIAENLLAAQNEDGGWPKNKDWIRVYPASQLSKLRGRSTFDNRSTWAQIDYLARVHQQTGLKRYATSAIKGIEYILAQQRASGGWRGSDVDAVTLNDDVMAGVLGTLKAVLDDRSLYAFVDDALLARVKSSYEEGLACILNCQIKVGERLTAWCQQHDHTTLEPVWARAFEPPSIVTAESVGMVRFLMSIENPSPQVIEAVQSAVAWFDHVKINGLRVDKIKTEPVKFKYHWTDYDYVEAKDPAAPPIWTRYYDLKTETPIFCTRQRKITSNYTDLSHERRTGYSWYGYWPARLLEKEYPDWQQRWAPDKNVLERHDK